MAPAQQLSDAETVAKAAGLELAMNAIYDVIATRGLLDEPTLHVLAINAAHHREHAAAFNRRVTADDIPEVTEPDAALLEAFFLALAGAADGPALLEIARSLEATAAATYTAAVGLVGRARTAELIAGILPVEAQHAAVLATMLGRADNDRLPAFEPSDDRFLEG
jgi:hypothetical protein